MADVTITQATAMHALSATTPDDPAAEVQMRHWNSAHGVSVVLAASAILGLFSNANGFEWGTSDGAITGSYTVPAQSVQTQAAGAIARSGFTTTTVAGDKIAATQNSNGLLMAVPAYLTTYAAQSVQTQPAGNIAGAGATTATTAGTEIKVTLNSAGISMGVPAYLTAAEGGGGAGTGFTTTTVGGAVVAGTLNSDGLLLAVPAYLTTYAAQTVQTQASGNIPRTGFTTTTAGGSVIAGTHDTAGLLLAVPPYITTYVAQTVQTQNMVALHAHGANGTATFTSGTVNLHAGNNVTLSTGANAVSIHAPAGGPGGGATLSTYHNHPINILTTVGTVANNSASILFLPMREAVTATRLEIPVSVSVATAANTSSGAILYTLSAYIYTKTGDTLNSVSSGTFASTHTWNSNATGSMTGGRFMQALINVNASAGNYFLGLHLSTRATGHAGPGSTSLGNTITVLGVGTGEAGAFTFGAFNAATASSNGWYTVGMNSSTGNLTQVSLSNVTQAGTGFQRANVAIRMYA